MVADVVMRNDPILLPDRAAALARYPHARVVGPGSGGALVFVSGISSRRSDNSHDGVTLHTDGRVEKDIRVQTRAVLTNIEVILQAAGATLADVVDITVFLVDMADYAGMNEEWNARFADKVTAPARTTVAVHQLPHPNLLVEMKAVALVPSSSLEKP
ncbi:MAG: RidA family protein [Deltaproteobacteria bacterium]|nr:RidA family protein [Deltaproteobacteria bacterium]